MSTMETCQMCKKAYVPETRKYKLDDFLETNKICDDCFEKVMRWILFGDNDTDYCIYQKPEITMMNLTDEQLKMLRYAEKICILQTKKDKENI